MSAPTGAGVRTDSPRDGGRPTAEARALDALPRHELERIMIRGERPDPEALIGWEFRGFNVAFWAPYSPIRKFTKGFFRGRDGATRGYNLPIVQDGLDRPWRAKPSDAAPKRFGFYLVTDPAPEARDNAYLHALLLDYGRGDNPLLDPSRVLRDYLVRVRPGSDDLLLGKATVALGTARIPTNYFVLQRHRLVSGGASPPQSPPRCR